MALLQEDILAAQDSRRKWRAPVSVMLAQYGIESAFGRFEPIGSNNGLGIQALPGLPSVEAPSHEVIRGVLVPVMERFAKFDSREQMFDKYGELMATGSPYRAAMIYADDPEKFAMCLTKYSTTPGYTNTVLNFMKQYDLTQYDVPYEGPIVTTHAIITAPMLNSIRMLQVALNRLGADPRLIVDGAFGAETEEAVKKFQGGHGLDVDGDAGPDTKAAIIAALVKTG